MAYLLETSLSLSLSFLSPLLNKVSSILFGLNIYCNWNFQLESAETDKDEDNVNRTTITTVLLPLSPLFDAAVDDDYLAVQSLLSKNYDVNTKV